MKFATSFLLPIASASLSVVPGVQAAADASVEASQQPVMNHPPLLAIVGLGGFLSICFFLQRSR